MPSLIKLAYPPNRAAPAEPTNLGQPGVERKVVRDFAVLLGAALATGLTAGLGMVLAVLFIS